MRKINICMVNSVPSTNRIECALHSTTDNIAVSHSICTAYWRVFFFAIFLSCVHIAYLSLTILIDRNTKVCLYSDNNDSPLNLVRLNHTKKNYVKPNQNNMQKRNKNHSHAASFFLVSSQHENHRNLFCIYTIHYWSLSFISFRFQFVFDLFCFTSLDFSQVRCDHWYAIEFYNDTRIVI